MHFGLTEDQKLLQTSVRDFASGELPPDRLRRIFDDGAAFDADIWKGAADLGLLGLPIPEEYRGSGLALLDLALVFEVFGETAMPGPFLSHALASIAITRAGTEEQKKHWLPALATGEKIATFAIAEGGDGWDADTWATRIADERISGTKAYVEHADIADLIVAGAEGGRLALVERGADGVSVSETDGVDRTRRVFQLDLADAPCTTLGATTADTQAVLDAGRVLLSADAFGAAWSLIRRTIEYALTREQFDTPIAQFQSVKHQLSDLATVTEPMRGLIWYAAYAYDNLPDELPREAALTKAHVTENAVETGRSAVELHGGIGFTWECDVQFWVKRTMFDRAWLGTPRVQRERAADLAGW